MKIALVGCGVIAASHARILKRVQPEAQVYVCDVDGGRAEELARKSGAAGAYGDFSRLLAEQKPDTVHITTPPGTHAELAETGLSAGCHVFVEKPVAETADEYRRIAAAARKAGKILACDYSTLGMPVVMRAVNDIRSGAFGRLIAVHCNFAGSEGGGVIPYGNPRHWAYALKGGILQNMVDHPLSLILAVLDPVLDHNLVVSRRNILPHDCPDLLHVALRTEDQIGSITLSLGHGCNERRAQFLLDGGTIMIDMGRQLYSSNKGRGPQNFVKKALSGITEGYAYAGGTVGNMVAAVRGKLQRDPGIVNVMQAFYNAIHTGSPLLASHETVERLTVILDDIWKEVNYTPGRGCEEVPA